MEQCLQQLVNGLMIGSTYAVVALGFGLIFSVMRVVNLAHPEIFMVGAYVAFVVITRLHVPGQGLEVSVAVLGSTPSSGFAAMELLAGQVKMPIIATGSAVPIKK